VARNWNTSARKFARHTRDVRAFLGKELPQDDQTAHLVIQLDAAVPEPAGNPLSRDGGSYST